MDNRKRLIIIFTGIVILLIGGLIYSYWARMRSVEEINAESETREGIDKYQEQLEEKHPLIKLLPHYEDDFELHYGVQNFEAMDVVYSLIIKINNLSDEEGGDEDLYYAIKDRAFGWIVENGGDPSKMAIEIESRTPSTAY